jgi:DNA-binding PadR family transcriptional regulator
MPVARRLTPHWFHMLLALADGERHGQGIMQAVLDETHGRIRLWPAMLYRNLDQLCDAGLVTERPAQPTSMAGSPRFFRITAKGRRACAAEAERLAAVVATARSKRLLRKT